MAAHAESPNIRIFGYLQHKGKKKLISFWRKYFCVLSGRIILFYTSESAYQNLENYHHSLDLGLVYAVQPALGIENAIQISTHLGPQWLRARDDLVYESWLSALQRACNTSTKEKIASDTEHVELPNISHLAVTCRDHNNCRERKALSINLAVDSFSKLTESDQSCKADMRVKNSSSKRISLNFVPGYGRKYPSYDGIRTFNAVESSLEAVYTDTDADFDVDQQSTKPGAATLNLVKRRINKEVENKQPRPLSESVSDFLLLNSPTKKEAPFTKSPVVNRRTLQTPRLPTNEKLNKLLLRVEDLTGSVIKQDKELSHEKRQVKSMSNLLALDNEVELLTKAVSDNKVDLANAAACSPEKTLFLKQPSEELKKLNPDIIDAELSIKDAQKDLADEASPVADDAAYVSNVAETGTSEVSKCSSHDSAVCTKNKGKRIEKRRKSGLDKLKHFLKFTKTSKCKLEGNQADTMDVQTLDQGEISIDTSLKYLDCQQGTNSVGNPQEEENDTSVDEQHSKILFSKSQPVEQQISDGRGLIREEPIIAEVVFECERSYSEYEEQPNDSDCIDIIQLEKPEQQRKNSLESFPVQSRQRKYSADSLTQQVLKPRSRRPSTKSFELDDNNRSSRNFDPRRSTIRALDFNFDLSTLDVVVNDSLPLPVKSRSRAISPGKYDKPSAFCKHCSVPIFELVFGDVARKQEVETNENTNEVFSLSDLIANDLQENEISQKNEQKACSISVKDQPTNFVASSSNTVTIIASTPGTQMPNYSGENEPTKGNNATLVKVFHENQVSSSIAFPNEENNRLSYALTEEEVVLEETLNSIDADEHNLIFA